MKLLINRFLSIFKRKKASEPTNLKLKSIDVIALRQHFIDGEELSNAKQYKEAVIKFDLVINDYGLFDEVYSLRGSCLQALEFHLDAIDDFDKSIELFPKDANNYFFRSVSLSSIGEYDLAIQDHRKAIDLSKEDSQLNNERNENAIKMGYESATRVYEARLDTLLFFSKNPYSLNKINNPRVRRDF